MVQPSSNRPIVDCLLAMGSYPLHTAVINIPPGVSYKQSMQRSVRRVKQMHTRGIEPRSQAWEACMMPLHYVCGYFWRVCVSLYVIYCIECVQASLCVINFTRYILCVCMFVCVLGRDMLVRPRGCRPHGGSPHLETKCRDPGSNRGPSDLRSDALPTELSRLDQVVVHVPSCKKTSAHGRLLAI